MVAPTGEPVRLEVSLGALRILEAVAGAIDRDRSVLEAEIRRRGWRHDALIVLAVNVASEAFALEAEIAELVGLGVSGRVAEADVGIRVAGLIGGLAGTLRWSPYERGVDRPVRITSGAMGRYHALMTGNLRRLGEEDLAVVSRAVILRELFLGRRSAVGMVIDGEPVARSVGELVGRVTAPLSATGPSVAGAGAGADDPSGG